MNIQANTPPNGDFAKLVEQLAAEAARPKRAPASGEHALDVGMTPSSAPHGAAAPEAAPGSVPRPTPAEVLPRLLVGLGIGWVVLLLILLASGAPPAVLIVVFVGGIALGRYLWRRVLPAGVASLTRLLEQMPSQQRVQQRQPQQERRPK